MTESRFASFRALPPPPALAWVAAAVGPNAAIDSVVPLNGASTSAVHAIRVVSPGGFVDLVLRRFVWQQFLREEPDRPGHEAAVLAGLSGTPVPAPELIAVDCAGTACDVPALLMTRLPGCTEERPANWLQAAAAAVAGIHRVEAPQLAFHYRPYFVGHELRPPEWGDGPLWSEAFAVAAGWATGNPVFIHRDYHPGNLLWENGDLGGIVDWLAACRGPAGADVSHFRVNLALDCGPDAVAAFGHAYEATARDRLDPLRDIVAAVDFLPFFDEGSLLDRWPDRAPDANARRQRLESLLVEALSGI